MTHTEQAIFISILLFYAIQHYLDFLKIHWEVTFQMGAGNSLKIIIFNNLAYLDYTVQKQTN